MTRLVCFGLILGLLMVTSVWLIMPSTPNTVPQKRAATPTPLEQIFQQEFPAQAQASGFVCSQVSTVFTKGLTERGFLFRIFCNQDLVNYRVIVTPQDRVIIRPWSE